MAPALALVAVVCAGQTTDQVNPGPYLEIRIPPSLGSEQLFVRYVLSGQDFGGGIYAPAGAPAFRIGTLVDGQPAPGIKALLYAPGCAVQIIDLDLTRSGADPSSFAYSCQPVEKIELEGLLTTLSGRIAGHRVNLQATYVAHWAQPFLGLGNDLITGIPVAQAELAADGRFRVQLPDLSANPLPSGWNEHAEFLIVAKDVSTGAAVALLVPDRALRTAKGGLQLRKRYPESLNLAPCSINSQLAHDAEGFAIRPETSHSCPF